MKQVIAPILESVTNIVDLNLELSCISIYQSIITDIEIQTGAKSNLNRDLPEDKIAELPEVKASLSARIFTFKYHTFSPSRISFDNVEVWRSVFLFATCSSMVLSRR